MLNSEIQALGDVPRVSETNLCKIDKATLYNKLLISLIINWIFLYIVVLAEHKQVQINALEHFLSPY